MRIRILRTIILEPGITAVQGQIFPDVPDDAARKLIAEGKAEPYESVWNPVLPTVEHREPEVEHRDPEPARVKRGRRGRGR